MNSKQVNETVKKLVSFMQDVKDGDLRTILENMQKMNDYMAEKLRIYEEHLTLLTGKARLELTDSDKRRLARKGKELVSPQSPPCQKSGEQNFWSCFFAFECVRTDFSSLTGKR